MTYLNQYHKESTERMLRKLAEWKKSPTSSSEAAQTMKRNLALALSMEATYIANNAMQKNMPKNVLKDIDGDLYVIDAEIKVKSNQFCSGCPSEG